MTSTQAAGGSSKRRKDSSQAEYTPSDWSNAAWEVIGELEEKQEFRPLEVEVSQGSQLAADPMFADFGAAKQSQQVRRWHLPDNITYDADAFEREEQQKATREKTEREQELSRVREEAFAAGREAAISEAVAENSARMEQIEQRLTAIFHDLDEQVRDNVVEMERQAVELALQVAKKIIDQAVEINPEYIISIIREAVAGSGGALIRKVRISPQDMEFVEYAGLRKQLKEYDGTWDFEADDTIRSGCIVETSASEVDFQLDKAWDRVREQVVKVIR